MILNEAIVRKIEGHGRGLALQVNLEGEPLESAGTPILKPGVFYKNGRAGDLKGCVEEEKKHPEC